MPSKMIVEFKTRAGDKWTSLRHYDSGPWSGGGNPHWAAINVTLRAVKSNAGIGERKKDVQDWPHYPAQWSNARGLWDFYSPAHTFAQGMHERLTTDSAQDIAGFKFFINSDALCALPSSSRISTSMWQLSRSCLILILQRRRKRSEKACRSA